jgi:hypothetical protein
MVKPIVHFQTVDDPSHALCVDGDAIGSACLTGEAYAGLHDDVVLVVDAAGDADGVADSCGIHARLNRGAFGRNVPGGGVGGNGEPRDGQSEHQ